MDCLSDKLNLTDNIDNVDKKFKDLSNIGNNILTLIHIPILHKLDRDELSIPSGIHSVTSDSIVVNVGKEE